MYLLLLVLCILNLSGNQIQGLQNMFKYLLEAESQMGTDKNDENVVGYSVGVGHSVPVAAGVGDNRFLHPNPKCNLHLKLVILKYKKFHFG